MRIILITLALISLCAVALGLNLRVDISSYSQAANSDDYPKMLTAGSPMLPYFPLKVLLPFGEKYEAAEIILGDHNALRGVSIPYAQAQQPISLAALTGVTQADPAIYGHDALYPAKDWEYLGTQYYRGYAVAIFNV